MKNRTKLHNTLDKVDLELGTGTSEAVNFYHSAFTDPANTTLIHTYSSFISDSSE